MLSPVHVPLPDSRLSQASLFLIFGVSLVLMLVLDLGVFQRRTHFPGMGEAVIWSIVWIALSLAFNAAVWANMGSVKGLEFFTGYLIEKALSVDNLFVFIVIFAYFAVPKELHHKVLFWGILGAVISRGLFIGAGAALVARFHWVLYLFGAFLIYTALKLARGEEEQVEPERNPIIRYCRKVVPLTQTYEGAHFFVTRDGRRYMTPLFLVLIAIETTDIAFATDSIPAIFAVTRDTFVIFTSNICAILGLRAMYFVLANVMKKFRYLQFGLSLVLGFIGAKMLIEPFFAVSIGVSLGVIFVLLAGAVLLSLLNPAKKVS